MPSRVRQSTTRAAVESRRRGTRVRGKREDWSTRTEKGTTRMCAGRRVSRLESRRAAREKGAGNAHKTCPALQHENKEEENVIRMAFPVFYSEGHKLRHTSTAYKRLLGGKSFPFHAEQRNDNNLPPSSLAHRRATRDTRQQQRRRAIEMHETCSRDSPEGKDGQRSVGLVRVWVRHGFPPEVVGEDL